MRPAQFLIHLFIYKEGNSFIDRNKQTAESIPLPAAPPGLGSCPWQETAAQDCPAAR